MSFLVLWGLSHHEIAMDQPHHPPRLMQHLKICGFVGKQAVRTQTWQPKKGGSMPTNSYRHACMHTYTPQIQTYICTHTHIYLFNYIYIYSTQCIGECQNMALSQKPWNCSRFLAEFSARGYIFALAVWNCPSLKVFRAKVCYINLYYSIL